MQLELMIKDFSNVKIQQVGCHTLRVPERITSKDDHLPDIKG